MQAEGLGQLFVRLLTANFEEAVAARAEKRAAVFTDDKNDVSASSRRSSDRDYRNGPRGPRRRAHLLSPKARRCACSPATASGWSAATARARPPPCGSWPAKASRTPDRSTRTGEIGYLPQDPREGDLDVLARDRVLSARGLDSLLTDLEKQQALMAEVADDDRAGQARSAATASWRSASPRWAATPPRAKPAGSARASACPTGC